MLKKITLASCISLFSVLPTMGVSATSASVNSQQQTISSVRQELIQSAERARGIILSSGRFSTQSEIALHDLQDFMEQYYDLLVQHRDLQAHNTLNNNTLNSIHDMLIDQFFTMMEDLRITAIEGSDGWIDEIIDWALDTAETMVENYEYELANANGEKKIEEAKSILEALKQENDELETSDCPQDDTDKFGESDNSDEKKNNEGGMPNSIIWETEIGLPKLIEKYRNHFSKSFVQASRQYQSFARSTKSVKSSTVNITAQTGKVAARNLSAIELVEFVVTSEKANGKLVSAAQLKSYIVKVNRFNMINIFRGIGK